MEISFTTPQIVEVTGLPKRAVQFWIKKGVLLPSEKASGSGVHNKFYWREIEIAKLLSPLHSRNIQTEDLSKVATAFREIMTLGQTGFIAKNPDLLEFANEQIGGGGPSVSSFFRHSGSWDNRSSNEIAKEKEWIKSTTMTENQAAKFWCFVAYGIARKGLPASWEIWWDDDELSVHARFDEGPEDAHRNGLNNNPSHGHWNRAVISGEHRRPGFVVIVDLSSLKAA